MWVGIVTLATLLGCGGWDDATFGPANTVSRPATVPTNSPASSVAPPTREMTLRWIPSPSTSAGVVRYDLSVGQSSGSYQSVIRIPANSATRASDGVLSYPLTVRRDVDLYLAIRAVDSVQSSPLSNEIRVAAVPILPPIFGGGGNGTASPSTAAATTSTLGGGGSGSAGLGEVASNTSASGVVVAAGSPPIDSAADPSSADDGSTSMLRSIEFDGFSEYLANSLPGGLDVAAPFTLTLWLQPTLDQAPRRVLFDAESEPGSSVDGITLALIDGHEIELLVRGADGEVAMRARYEFAAVDGAWQQLALVFDPGFDVEPRLYLDLEACRLVAIEPEGAVFEPRESGFVSIGGAAGAVGDSFLGRIGHVALWNSVLSWEALAEVQARGHTIDLRSETAAYSSAGSLVHYWPLGDQAEELGYDQGRSAQPLDLDDVAGGIAYDDIVLDGPGGLEPASPNP